QILEDVLNDLAGNPRPLEVRIMGEDQKVLVRIAGDVEGRLRDTPHLVDYYRGVEGDVPMLRYALDADAAARGGIDSAQVGGDLGGLVTEVGRRLRDLSLPAGYRIEVGGRAESQARAFRQLMIVLGLGIMAVFAVLVAQFRAGRAALLVLFTVPPALAGGVL